MIPLALISSARLWLEPSSIGALQRSDDDLIGRIFSLVFLAFVLLWPVIQRKINEAQERQRQQGGGSAPGSAPGPRQDPRRDALEELFGGADLDEVEDDVEPWTGGAGPFEPAGPVVDGGPPEGRAAPPRREAPRSAPAPDAPPPLRPAPRLRELGGDPFDDSRMGGDLVPESALPDTPPESQLERGRFDEDAAAATLRRASFRSTPLSSGSSSTGATASGRASRALGSSLSTGLANGVGVGSGSASRAATRAALRRLERRYSHWQRAFVLREVLGPPRSAQLFDDPRR